MPLITLDIPQHKMPIVKEFIEVIGLKERTSRTFTNETYTQTHSTSRQNLPSSYYSPSRGWEFFNNELEFE
jgi:hypothetical protein